MQTQELTIGTDVIYWTHEVKQKGYGRQSLKVTFIGRTKYSSVDKITVDEGDIYPNVREHFDVDENESIAEFFDKYYAGQTVVVEKNDEGEVLNAYFA